MYGKLFGSIFDGTLHGRFEATVTMMALIALADRDGVVDMTPQAIISRAGWPADVITRGLEELAQPDPHSRSDAAEGRRITLLDDRRQWGWRLVNYSQYRAMRTADERREYQREYWHRRKANSTELNPLNPLNQRQPISDADADAEADAEAEALTPPTPRKRGKSAKPTGREADDVQAVFECWREAWSHPQAKLDAKRRKLIAMRLRDYSADTLCAAIRGYRNSLHHTGHNDRHTVYDDIGLLLRDSAHVDAGLRFADQKPTRHAKLTAANIERTKDWVPPEMRGPDNAAA